MGTSCMRAELAGANNLDEDEGVAVGGRNVLKHSLLCIEVVVALSGTPKR